MDQNRKRSIYRGTTSKQVIDALKSIMARFGIPKIVFSDNAPQFSSPECLSFAKFYNFQSQNVKPLALLAYRATPLECGKSPAELFFGRQLQKGIMTSLLSH